MKTRLLDSDDYMVLSLVALNGGIHCKRMICG